MIAEPSTVKAPTIPRIAVVAASVIPVRCVPKMLLISAAIGSSTKAIASNPPLMIASASLAPSAIWAKIGTRSFRNCVAAPRRR